MKKILIHLVCCFLVLLQINESQAQVSNVLDGAYVKESNITKRVVPYPALREADVMYTKRIWQTLDLKEKINHPLLLSNSTASRIGRTYLTWCGTASTW